MTRILIVDDNEQNLYMLQVLLQGNGHEVVLARDGAEALERARSDPPDIIVADILMPVMDGFTLCREWQKDDRLKGIPFVFYTATYTDRKDEELALTLGAERFIVKPQEPDAFMGMLREVLEEHKAGRLVAPREPVEEEAVFFREYSEALIRKLEDKLVQLEEGNRALRRELAERKRAAEALRESEERYRVLFEGTAEGILVADVATKAFQYANPAICRMLGYSAEELKGMGVADIDPQEALPQVFSSFEAQVGGEKALSPGVPCLRKDGETIYADVSGALVRIHGRDCNVGFFTDVTERRSLEEQFRQAQKMEAIGRLAGGVAHDFNNLLTVINGYSQLALGTLDPDNPLRRDLQEIYRAGHRAAELTQQLLIFSRKQVLDIRVLDLNQVLRSMGKMLGRLIGEDVALEMRLSQDLGRIKADSGQINQVVMNLGVNARDAMPEGGGLVIETSNTTIDEAYAAAHVDVEPGRYVMLTISDTGHGMTKEVMEHIFEPFFTTKKVGEGTGLGLSTVYGIVKQSGGHISVYSEVGQGTTFRIYLPRIDKPRETEEVERTEARLPRGTETLLVVEDDAQVRDLAALTLRGLGYTVLEATHGREALDVCRATTGRIDLVLTDVVMPEMSGRRLAEELRATWPHCRVLYMSGYTHDVIARQGILEPGIDLIQKPFTMESLARRVRQVLDKGPRSGSPDRAAT